MTSQSLKDSAVEFLKLASSGKVSEAYDRYVGAGFRHHNPYFRGDAASLKAGMQENATKNPGKVCDIQRALQEGDTVAVVSHVRMRPEDPGFAVVHIFRFEDERIMELWDVGQAVPEKSLNENGMF